MLLLIMTPSTPGVSSGIIIYDFVLANINSKINSVLMTTNITQARLFSQH